MTIIRKIATASVVAVSIVGGSQMASAQGASQTVVITKIDPTGLLQAYRATKVVGATVVNDQNEKVGTIDDLLIQAQGSNRVIFAVISVGGFLGVGGRNIAVPYTELAAQDESHMVLHGATKEQVRALPEFKYQK